MNIKHLLEFGTNLIKENNIEDPFLKARMLLCSVLDKQKEYLVLHDNEEISTINIEKYKDYLNRLINNEPIQYIIGNQEFYGIDFFVNKDVLIPQPDTEILVEETIKICFNTFKDKESINILDLCTGSGAIGIVLAKKIENSTITLSDISNEALKVAKKNCKIVNKSIKVIKSDLFEYFEDKYDIIVSNPPYIKTDIINKLPTEVQKEPKLALDGGEDGLEVYRRIINDAYNYLNKDGFLCLEIGYDQKKQVIDLLNKSNKYKNIYSKKDLSRNDRVIICNKM